MAKRVKYKGPQIEEALRRVAEAKALRAEELDLGGLGLTDVPSELMELPWLKRLFLGRGKEARKGSFDPDNPEVNFIREINPALFSWLKNLELLDLSENRLKLIPEEINTLTSIKVLDIQCNVLTQVTPQICDLNKLEILSLHNNKLTFLLAEIAKLKSLKRLYIGLNNIKKLPPEIGALNALETLFAFGNGLEKIPPEIGALPELQTLSLFGNNLSALPPEIGNLAKLTRFDLASNPLVTPPKEVVDQGIEAIQAYLRELGRTGKQLFEAKVVLVGEGAVGKTTLKERLIRSRFATPGSTRGLELEALERPHPWLPGKSMTLNFWDFGGQEDYRPAQQFFFSKGALYLLLWNARYDATQSNVEAWMRLLRHRVGGGARVLVVATHADAHPPSDSVRQLLVDKFPSMLAGFYSVDSKSGRGIAELWRTIDREVTKLNEFGAERPKSWIEARDAVLAKRECAPAYQIPFPQFRELAIAKGVALDSVEIFAGMLTNQGRIVYHGDDPHLAGTVVLDPEWLMKAIAYVLTDEQTKDDNGILPETSLARIWLNHARAEDEKPICYEKEHWNHLLRMMDRHDIVYRLREHEWLVGQLVSVTKPRDLPWDGRRPIGNGAQLVTECRLDDQIPGLMALLIVRTHFYHYNFKRFCWREGVFLRDPNHLDTLALIEAESQTRFRISTAGTFAASLMERLSGSLEQLIHEMWPGGAATEAKPYAFIVPCPTEGCPGYYHRDDLFRDLAEGDDKTRCNEGRRCRHDIRKLLMGQPAPQAFDEFRRRFDRVDGQLAGIQGMLEDVRGQIGDILSLVSNEAPRIYSLRAVDPIGLMKRRIELQIWCEELNRPVAAAVEVVELDKEWVKHLRAWSPWLKKLLKLGASVAGGSLVADLLGDDDSENLKKLCEGTDKVLEGADVAIGEKGSAPGKEGRVELKLGEYVTPEVAAVLCKAAANGGMTRIQMDDDKRWRWVCREVADRNDRSVPKE
jgi:internalin A